MLSGGTDHEAGTDTDGCAYVHSVAEVPVTKVSNVGLICMILIFLTFWKIWICPETHKQTDRQTDMLAFYN